MAWESFRERAIHRIKRDLKNIKQNEEALGISIEIVNDNIFDLKGEITGPLDTPYEGGRFILEIKIPENYPFDPPKVRFVTKIWHPNFNSETGKTCLNGFEDWRPCQTLKEVLISLQALLSAPNTDDPEDVAVVKQYLENPKTFKLTAERWTQVYAKAPRSDAYSEQLIKPLESIRLHEKRQFVGEHEKGECEIDRTTSWPDGLHETSRFVPDFRRPVRRTDSFDDIQRHELYFDLVRKNQGNQFTWKHYCNILLSNLRSSHITASFSRLSIQPACTSGKSVGCKNSTLLKSVSSGKKLYENRAPRKRSFLDIEADVESVSSADDVKFTPSSKSAIKMWIHPSASPVQSDGTNFGIAAGTVSSMQNLLENHIPKKRSFLDVDADVESASSLDDEKFQTPSKNVLKKMCTEIRTLAQKTCKSVEKMTTATKYCSTCGDVIRSTTMHKKCSKQCTVQKDFKSPITPSMSRLTNPVASRHINFQSPTITPAFVLDQRTKKLRRKPLFKL